MNKKLLSIFLSTFLIFPVFADSNTIDFMNYLQSPNKFYDFYNAKFSPNLMEKIHTFEGPVQIFLEGYDETSGYKNHVLTAEEEALFQEYFSYLPDYLQQSILDNVLAIYFIDGMCYGGLTDWCFNENGDGRYCILYFNMETFHTTLSNWLEKRENTLFNNEDDENRFVVECSDEYMGFLQCFIHEAVHVYDYINLISETKLEEKKSEFVEIWKSQTQTQPKYSSPILSKIAFYGFGDQTSVKNGKKLLDYLSKSPFVTFYSAKNVFDNYAEEITMPYLYNQFGINYKVKYLKNGKVAAEYNLAEKVTR